MRFGPGLLIGIGLLVGASGACSDEAAVKSENSDLRTQLSQPESIQRTDSTPPPEPTSEIAEFCRAIREFHIKREALIVRFNEINATDEYFGSVTQSEEQELLALEADASSVRVVLPSAGGSVDTSQMNTLFLQINAADERFVEAIRTNDYAAHQAAREEANAAAEELHQLVEATCP